MANPTQGNDPSSKMNPVDISKALQGIDFPADKKKIEQYVQQNQSKIQGSKDVLNMIHRLPDRQYQNVADVEKNFGQIR